MENSAMSEIGAAFAAMKEATRAKRKANLAASTVILEKLNIPFESKNRGIHLVVTGNNELFDFWPSTGKFISRQGNLVGRGIRNLLRHCDGKNEETKR